MTSDLFLRVATFADLPLLFEQQRDPEANYMAAFTARDPSDWPTFVAHWSSVLVDGSSYFLAIIAEGQLAGEMVSYVASGRREVGYWLGKPYWGKGIATRALATFLTTCTERPLYAHVAKDNLASRRVLEKCGFRICGEDRGYATARAAIIEEYILKLDAWQE